MILSKRLLGAKVTLALLGTCVSAAEVIDLGSSEYLLYGTEQSARAGASVASAGGFLGGGALAVGEYLADPQGHLNAGAAYVLRDTLDPGNYPVAASDWRVQGTEAGGRVGYALSGGGDVNDDGIPDLAVGAWSVDGNDLFDSGAVFVFFGSDTLGGAVQPADADLFAYGEDAIDHFGWAVDISGDLNADGVHDIVIGSPLGQGGDVSSGEVFVFWGGAHLESGTLLDPATPDLHLVGLEYEQGAGHALATGDIDGDQIDDLLIGCPNKDKFGRYHCGVVYGFRGRTDFAPNEILELDIDYDLAVVGATSLEGHGSAVAVVGDMDGDGFGEIVTGSPYAGSGSNENAGRVYVVKGRSLQTPVLVDGLSQATRRYEGGAGGDLAGYAISAAGDFDGNGQPDVVIGAPGADLLDRDGAGAAYLVYAFIDSFPPSGPLGAAAGRIYVGAHEGDEAGAAFACLLDFGGAATQDLAIGAPGTHFETLPDAGAVHVVRGASALAVGDAASGLAMLPVHPTPSPGPVTVPIVLSAAGRVDAFVTDVTGRLVAALPGSRREIGSHVLRWDGRTRAGEPVPSGVYFFHVRGPGMEATSRLVILR